MKDLRILIGLIILCESVGILGAVFTTPSIPTWYATLAKPVFSAPNWLFFPVWTTLYLLMGVSAYLIWTSGMKKIAINSALMIFALQLTLNLLWSIAFFAFHSLLGGFIVIVFLWFAIAINIVSFGRLSRNAALILSPYLLWVTFAAILNFAVLMLN